MAIFKCKMCGGDLDVQEDMTVCECEYCGTKQTVPSADNEKKVNLFNRANRLRINSEFDKAAGVYESIVAEFPEESEAYWGLCLCTFGIEYVDDPATAKKIPTCHRTSYDSIFQDSNFDLACEYSDSIARQVYRLEAKEIDRLQKEILDIAKNEEPFDIFICYKETDTNGQRTKDSVLAQDIYDALIDKGYKVFFARITLEDKLGWDYEPYIFSALNSAKIMLAVGTNYEHFNAVWVKNEWSRFLALMKKDKSKTLIPCYCNIDAYDMPEEFKHLQGQDMSKVGFIQDLVRGIGKIIHGNKNGTQNTAVWQSGATQTSMSEPLFKRAAMCLEDEEWDKADNLYEQILNLEPENVNAYLGKLCAELHIQKMREIVNAKVILDEGNSTYKKIMRFADDTLKEELNNFNREIIYNNAISKFENALAISDYQNAGELFKSISGYKKSDELAEECTSRIFEITYNKAVSRLNGFPNKEQLVELKEFFAVNIDYKDSAQMLTKCDDRLKAIIDREHELEEQKEILIKFANRMNGSCQYCGSPFKGMIKKVCSNCGKPKDY